MNEKELEAWENSRDLVKEISDGVDEMLSGSFVKTKEVYVSEKIHNLRMKKVSEENEQV